MITEIVTFPLPAGTNREAAIELFETSVQNWSDNPDLIRKNYLFDPVRCVGGGVYLWKEQAHAEKWHGEAFRQRVQEVYGALPQSEYFETPIVVDNVVNKVVRE